MKLLHIPLDFSRHSEDARLFQDQLTAFQRLCECIIYTDIETAIKFKPDVVFYQGSLSFEECARIKRETGCIFTMFSGDARYAPVSSLMDYKSFVDAYFLPFSGELLKNYEYILGKPCYFLWEAFQDWKFRDFKELNTGVISYVGNLYSNLPGGKERSELYTFLFDNVINAAFHGSGFPKGNINNYEVPDLYQNSFAVIAENNFHDIPEYFTPRNLTAMAAGSLCLMKVFSGIEKHFTNWKHCIYYRTKYELLDIIDFLKKNPSIRNGIAREGHEYVRENYTMHQNAQLFFRHLAFLGKK